MKTLFLRLLSGAVFSLGLSLLFLVAPAAQAKALAPNLPKIEILSAEFGIEYDHRPNPPVFIPTRKVPFIENMGYGWEIRIQTPRQTVRWREELILPRAPLSWGEQEIHTQVSHDRRVAVTEHEEIVPEDGILRHRWYVVPGDPRGDYTIRVILDNERDRVFRFTVE